MGVRVKICGMTDAAGIRSAAGAGADALGFVFCDRSPRHLSVDTARALVREVPEGVTVVAVMLHPEREYCKTILEVLEPDVLQTDSEDFEYLEVPEGIERWPVFREGTTRPGDLPGRFVYEGRQSGQGRRVDWERAAGLASRGQMILAGGLDADNVSDAIRVVRPWAVDVSSAVESSPGVKDGDRIRRFIERARLADRADRQERV
jgi:phosphoribosylanthranilate isomerase